MGLACKNGGKSCDGCGECKNEACGTFCAKCGERICGDEVYGDLFYDTLCLSCLIKLHKN